MVIKGQSISALDISELRELETEIVNSLVIDFDRYEMEDKITSIKCIENCIQKSLVHLEMVRSELQFRFHTQILSTLRYDNDFSEV